MGKLSAEIVRFVRKRSQQAKIGPSPLKQRDETYTIAGVLEESYLSCRKTLKRRKTSISIFPKKIEECVTDHDEPMVDGEVGDTVVLDERGNAVVVTKDGERSQNNGESSVGEEDLIAVSGVEEEGSRVVV